VTTASYQVVNSAGQSTTLNLSNAPELENAIGTIYADTLRGTSGDNTLAGHGGNDTLIGRAGDDTYAFAGSQDLGTDTIVELANQGTDTLDFDELEYATGINVDLGSTSTDQQAAFEQGNRVGLNLSALPEIENVVGTDQDDTITGNNLDNHLS